MTTEYFSCGPAWEDVQASAKVADRKHSLVIILKMSLLKMFNKMVFAAGINNIMFAVCKQRYRNILSTG